MLHLLMLSSSNQKESWHCHHGVSKSRPTSRKREENIHINRTVANKEICDVIMNQVKKIFSFISEYSAVSLLLSIPEKNFSLAWQQITDVCSVLQRYNLKTDLGIIYKRPDFWNITAD